MTTQNHYTFGDSERAARRLELLARAYEPVSRAFLERYRPPELDLALDLGSGPGHTTSLVHEAARAKRTIGLEASGRYVREARERAPSGVEFIQEDVTRPSSAVPAAGLVFCRFLLTHLEAPAAAIQGFRPLVRAGGVLLLQETAHMESSHPALARYYELVGQLQSHYGQILYIGQELERLARGSAFAVLHSSVRRFEQPAATMAEIHAHNLRTWRTDPFAERAFDALELDSLEQQLQAIASGSERAAPVAMGLGELVLT